jgi:hypothetical protein
VSAQPERTFGLPPEPRAPWGAWLVAAVLQIGLMFLLISEPQVDRPPDAFRILLPTALSRPTPSVIMRYNPRLATRPVTQAKASAAPARPVRIGTPTAPRVDVPAGAAAPVGVAIVARPDTASARSTESPFKQHFGSGALWVSPLPVAPQDIAAQLGGESRQQIADSVLTAIIQGYIDRMAEEKLHQGPALPSWVTTIGGKKVGVDQKWIYLGPIKIPAALLALLPLNAGGNPTAADYNKRLSAMREDLFEAARRSANYDEFKKAVKGLRDETQRQRDYEKNRRTAPDSGHHG